MSVSYTCPNPECGVTLKTPSRVQVGKSVKCPKCSKPFVPEAAEKEKDEEPAGGTLKLADEPKKPGAKAPAAQAQAVPAAKKPFEDDDDEDPESVKKGYGVTEETEAEKEQAEKNKPKFTEVQDKFKKSARGPAMSLLVMPANLLTLAGLITCTGGLGAFVYGMWPLVFNDAPPGEEEMEEAIVMMVLGVVILFWGAMVCFGASQMQELASYPWALVGSIMGIAPLLVGIFGVIMLQNPKVKAGFAEGALLDDDEDEEEKQDGEDDDEDEEEDEDDDEESAKKRKGKRLARKGGRDEDEDE
jgi:hypothetical protein